MSTPRTRFVTYTARGSSPFPFDMLRYDAVYPADTESCHVLAECGSYAAIHEVHRDPKAPYPTFSVRLASSRQPTLARWASFGWYVSDINERRF